MRLSFRIAKGLYLSIGRNGTRLVGWRWFK
jgi:hypothetical protein